MQQRKHFSLLLTVMLALGARQHIHAAEMNAISRAVLKAASKPHPRLIFTEELETNVKKRLEKNPTAQGLFHCIRKTADTVLGAPPCTRKKVGRRLLGTSREVLKRVTILACSFRLSGENKYLERAQKELLAAAAFTDWNPGHYLDVGEMTTALAFGYDWLYHDLTKDAKEKIRTAIIEKGLKTYRPKRGQNNWNDVCNGGLLMGALSVAEAAPPLAEKTVAGAVSALPLALRSYGPHGNHPEGPGWYWHYATLFSVPALAALESACGTDFDLSETHKAYMKSGLFYVHMIGPTGTYFNYSDSGSGTLSLAPQLFWFYKKTREPGLLWFERSCIERMIKKGRMDSRLGVFSLFWLPDLTGAAPPEKLYFQGNGITPVATHRSSWTDSDALFVGLKGGSPKGPHAHMDGGSFIFEADGVRWACDLGAQSYHSLEKRGINLWGRNQDSDRWKIFRLGVYSHNTLVVDNKPPNVSGKAVIVRGDPRSTVMDLSSLYEGQLAQVMRGVQLVPGRRDLLIQDEITGGKKQAQVRWAMLTRADVTISPGKTHAVLKQNGKELHMNVLGYRITPHDLEMKKLNFETYRTDPPPEDYDTRNRGTCMIGFTAAIEAEEQVQLRVTLVSPEADKRKVLLPLLPLKEWGEPF